MRVLITGGAGFIGSHLAEALLHAGDEVTIVDDLSTGSADNIQATKSHVRFEYHLDSIFNHRLMAELIDFADVVFHLAAAVGVRNIIERPIKTIETNVSGTELVLKLAAKKKKRVVITSSSEVYGKTSKFPFQESDDLVLGSTFNSRWSYACSKALDEFLALAYASELDLPVTIVRLFNTAGPRQTGRYGMVVPTFVKQALLGEPVTVYGSGEQSRCFCHVTDVVRALMACAALTRTTGDIFNIGSTHEVSINELAKRVILLTDSRSEIVHIPREQAYGPGFEDIERRLPDISKAQMTFGFSPTRDLDGIIYDVADYVRNHQMRNVTYAH